VISTLLDKKLITTAGRKEVMGRPILYKTSKEFLIRFGLSDLDELPSLKEFEALAREALGTDEEIAAGEVSEERVGELHPEVDAPYAAAAEHTHATTAETIEHVKGQLGAAEEFREHEALATAEGMPSGQLDEDPPPPSAKTTTAGE